MIKIWFLMAYIAYPDVAAIVYKGFGGYEDKEECESLLIPTENYIVEFEARQGRTTLYVNVACEEILTFPGSIKPREPKNETSFGA